MTVHGLFAKAASEGAGANAKPHIAIIGRGFSGVMMAIALMKSVRTAFHVHLFDPQPTISGGQVLAAAQSGEILNSRVRDLSVAAGQRRTSTIGCWGIPSFARRSLPPFPVSSRSLCRRASSATTFISAFPKR